MSDKEDEYSEWMRRERAEDDREYREWSRELAQRPPAVLHLVNGCRCGCCTLCWFVPLPGS